MSLHIPKTRLVFVTSVGVILIGGLLSVCYYPLSKGQVVLLGLGIDLIGAVVLAVPDIPSLNTLFESGHLQRARETTIESFPSWAIADPEVPDDSLLSNSSAPRFVDLLALLRENYEESNYTESEIDWDEIDVISQGSKEFYPGDERMALILSGAEEDLYFELEAAKYYVDERIRKLDSRFRRNGIVLLGLGFIVQGISVFIQSGA